MFYDPGPSRGGKVNEYDGFIIIIIVFATPVECEKLYHEHFAVIFVAVCVSTSTYRNNKTNRIFDQHAENNVLPLTAGNLNQPE